MKDIDIVDAVRTATGSHGGALRTVSAQELGKNRHSSAHRAQ